MSTTPSTIVPINAIDASGLSVVTSPPSPTDPRAGAIFSPPTLAAGAPVWFHPLKDGRFIMVMNRAWSAATPVGGMAGVFSSFTETLSCWAIVSGTSGIVTMPSVGLQIPVSTKNVSAYTTTGAASRPQDLLWVLHTATVSGQRQGILQSWNVAPNGTLSTSGEEVLPSTPTVVFDKGVDFNGKTMIHVYGTDSAGNLYRIRKHFGRVGYNQTKPNQVTNTTGLSWQYYTGTGWSDNVADLAPMQAGLTSVGPVSFGFWRTQTILATVGVDGVLRKGLFWTANAGRDWKQAGEAIDLGSTSDGSYLGAGLMLQNQVGAGTVGSAGANAAIPYVSTKRGSSGGNSLSNSWGLRLVNLVS